MRSWAAAHRKLLVYALGAVLMVAAQWAPDNQWVTLAVAVATGLGVYQARNTADPAGPARPGAYGIPQAPASRGGAAGPPPGEPPPSSPGLQAPPVPGEPPPGPAWPLR